MTMLKDTTRFDRVRARSKFWGLGGKWISGTFKNNLLLFIVILNDRWRRVRFGACVVWIFPFQGAHVKNPYPLSPWICSPVPGFHCIICKLSRVGASNEDQLIVSGRMASMSCPWADRCIVCLKPLERWDGQNIKFIWIFILRATKTTLNTAMNKSAGN